MSTMRQSNQLDVKDKGGARQLTASAGNSVTFQVNAGQDSRIGANSNGPGLYNCVRAILLEYDFTVVRLTGGTTPIYPDQFPRVVSGVGITTNLFGTIYDSTYINGMVLKEITEFFGRGYTCDGINRQVIPGTDGTYTRTSEICIPFSQETNDFPDDFAMWLGWLDEMQIQVYVSGAAQPFGLAGVTISGNVTFRCTLGMIPTRNLVIPPFMTTRRYQQTASAGANGPVLTNVGSTGGMQGVDDGARLDAMLFAHQVGGFTGSGTADQITQIAMSWRNQNVTQNISGFFERFLNATKKPPRFGYNPAVTVQVTDNTNPYAMSNNPGTGQLNDASARYTPLVYSAKGSLISYMQKVKGNYPLDQMTFSTDQTNQFAVYTRELKQFSLSKVAEMLAAASINPAKVTLLPKLGRKNWKKIDATKAFCLPRVVAVGA